jgi:hypothetical protein
MNQKKERLSNKNLGISLEYHLTLIARYAARLEGFVSTKKRKKSC